MKFLRNHSSRILTAALVLQGGLYYAVSSRAENVPSVSPLATFPSNAGQWETVRELPIEKAVQDVLRADDTLNRVYAARSGASASLFIAFFKTQRFGQAPHSPKNCLPGSGWEPIETGTVTVPVAGRTDPVTINRYVVAHGNSRSVVLYWYHSHERVIASEYWAKFWLVADAVRHNRSDTALVKIVIPVEGNHDAKGATDVGVNLVQSIFADVERQFPS
jgi:EpsI family protein